MLNEVFEVYHTGSDLCRIDTRVKTLNLFPVDENRLQQCCAAPHEQCCQQQVAILLSITRCNKIVDDIVHGVPHNIVEACFHQPGTTCAFLAVYLRSLNDQFNTRATELRSLTVHSKIDASEPNSRSFNLTIS